MYNTTIINAEMERLNLTNEKLAVKAGLSGSTISAIRNGDEKVRLTSLKKAARALSLKIEIRLEKAA
jgi:transcriptional regulator with XRE-family HTH domain